MSLIVVLALILVGCYGPNATPVTPDYPPEPPFAARDAGYG